MPEEKPLSENLFRTPSDGEKRAEGVAWSVFGGNERKPERKTEENPVEGRGHDIALIVYPGKVSDFSLLESGFTSLLDRVYRR